MNLSSFVASTAVGRSQSGLSSDGPIGTPARPRTARPDSTVGTHFVPSFVSFVFPAQHVCRSVCHVFVRRSAGGRARPGGGGTTAARHTYVRIDRCRYPSVGRQSIDTDNKECPPERPTKVSARSSAISERRRSTNLFRRSFTDGRTQNGCQCSLVGCVFSLAYRTYVAALSVARCPTTRAVQSFSPRRATGIRLPTQSVGTDILA